MTCSRFEYFVTTGSFLFAKQLVTISSLSVHFSFYLYKNTLTCYHQQLHVLKLYNVKISASLICIHSGVGFALYGEGGRKHALHVLIMSDHEFYGMYYHYYATSFVIIMSWICIVLGLDNACAYVIQIFVQ